MVKIKVNKGKFNMEIEGRGDEIIAEMIVAIKGFYNALAKNDTEEAETFRRLIFLREDLIFGQMTKVETILRDIKNKNAAITQQKKIKTLR